MGLHGNGPEMCKKSSAMLTSRMPPASVCELQLYILNFIRRYKETATLRTYSVSQKSSPPLKLFVVFSLPVNLCNLSEYLCEMYHFTRKTPQTLRIQFSLLRNS